MLLQHLVRIKIQIFRTGDRWPLGCVCWQYRYCLCLVLLFKVEINLLQLLEVVVLFSIRPILNRFAWFDNIFIVRLLFDKRFVIFLFKVFLFDVGISILNIYWNAFERSNKGMFMLYTSVLSFNLPLLCCFV